MTIKMRKRLLNMNYYSYFFKKFSIVIKYI